jgi:dihydropteroate synthase
MNKQPSHLRCARYRLEIGRRTLVMGIVNVTPDSFSGDGLGADVGAAVERGLRMVEEGADILDIGGESTRPGSEAVSVDEELRRVIPVIEGIARRSSAPISIDTYKARVAREALAAGACIVNDITGLRSDAKMPEVARQAGAAVIVMHMQGTPRTMQDNPHYDDVIGEISAFLKQQADAALAAGIARDQIVVDPGIGFGKNLEHNLEILRRLAGFKALGYPVLVGPSRKRFIGTILDLPVDQRLEGTAAAVALAIANGADIVRVHDVAQMVRVARVADAIARRT